MISMKTRYGLRALTHLAACPRDEPVLATQIAEIEGIPTRYLQAILGSLRTRGILRSRHGPHGGYWLSAEPHDIQLAEVVKALEGESGRTCLDANGRTHCPGCPRRGACAVARALMAAEAASDEVLARWTLSDLLADAQLAAEQRRARLA